MSKRSDDTTSPISQVNNRVVPVREVNKARKSITADSRIAQAKRTFAALAAAAEDPPILQRGSFDINGLGTMKTGRLGNFRVFDEKENDRIGFTMAFEYQGPKPLRHVTESEDLHKAIRKTLFNNDLVFSSAAAATVFKIEVSAVVPAYISITSEPDASKVEINLRHVGMLGATNYTVAAESLDRKMIEALVELVSTGNSDFYGLAAKAQSGKR
ncbi:MAG: hypothetical protein ACPHUF_03220 [Gammaproteobacteria bacterium]